MLRDVAPGAAVLVGLWRDVAQGRPLETPPVVPPHLLERAWTFVCACVDPATDQHPTWDAIASATVCEGRVRAPRRPCPRCGRWTDGDVTLT